MEGREIDNGGDLPGEPEVGGEREFGLLRMLRGCVSVRDIGKGDDGRANLRGPSGRGMMVSLPPSIVASCGQGDNNMSPAHHLLWSRPMGQLIVISGRASSVPLIQHPRTCPSNACMGAVAHCSIDGLSYRWFVQRITIHSGPIVVM